MNLDEHGPPSFECSWSATYQSAPNREHASVTVMAAFASQNCINDERVHQRHGQAKGRWGSPERCPFRVHALPAERRRFCESQRSTVSIINAEGTYAGIGMSRTLLRFCSRVDGRGFAPTRVYLVHSLLAHDQPLTHTSRQFTAQTGPAREPEQQQHSMHEIEAGRAQHVRPERSQCDLRAVSLALPSIFPVFLFLLVGGRSGGGRRGDEISCSGHVHRAGCGFPTCPKLLRAAWQITRCWLAPTRAAEAFARRKLCTAGCSNGCKDR